VGGNLWRTTGDINDTWDRMADIGFGQLGLAKYAAPGHWNDPDMLEVGNGGMTDTEYRAHMSLWSILAAPLLAGNDLSKMSPETKAILLNKEVIAVDQDKLGKQGDRAMAWGMTEIWTRPLSDGALAAGLFNRDTEAHSVTLHLRDVGFSDNAKLRDLWAHKDVSASDGAYTVTVPGHGVVMLKLSR
jgi:alpha-galactosidase